MTWFRCGGIPQSVLDLLTVSSASGSIATFDTDLTDNLIKCVADIQAVQSGTGTPSPSNPRSISGFSNCVITANSTPITVALGQTVYGGYLNVLSGVLTITHIGTDLANYTGTITKITIGGIADKSYFRFDDLSPYPLITNGELICDKFEKVTITTSTTDKGVGLGSPSALGHSTVYLRPENPNSYTISTIMDYIQNTLNGLFIVYKLQEADYIKVQLSSNQIQTLLGQNNILADTGDIDVEFLETVGNKIGG